MDSDAFHSRQHPTHGVFTNKHIPTIVFLTVCTKDHQQWLTTTEVHGLLRVIWKQATAWLVGKYVIMPDHVHLFVAPGTKEISFDNWVQYWKSQFSKQHKNPANRWQTDHWDRRLRSWENYRKKWEYVCHNPVRHGLVEQVEDWAYKGEIHDLLW